MNQILKCEISEEFYLSLEPEIRDQITVNAVVVEGVDHSTDELWNELKKKSIKAYKELKQREFDLLHNVKQINK